MFGVKEKARSNYLKDQKEAKKIQEQLPPYENVKDEYMSNVIDERKEHTKKCWESHKLHSGIAKAMNSV